MTIKDANDDFLDTISSCVATRWKFKESWNSSTSYKVTMFPQFQIQSAWSNNSYFVFCRSQKLTMKTHLFSIGWRHSNVASDWAVSCYCTMVDSIFDPQACASYLEVASGFFSCCWADFRKRDRDMPPRFIVPEGNPRWVGWRWRILSSRNKVHFSVQASSECR